MINQKYIYLDTRPGFGPFGASDAADTQLEYYEQLIARFNRSNGKACSYWGLAQVINQLEFQLKNNEKVITVLGPEKFVSGAMAFLQEKIPAYVDFFTTLTSDKNNND